jgi:tetratricopeptide (TPR) repeat protein
MTAKYNGHFNAEELLNQAILTYNNSRKDDFYSILPISPLPNETEVKGMFPSIDTAVVKCSKVILNHSMPSAEDMSTKEVEHNKWIDENWITVGKALFYRRDYDKALKNFLFVKRFFKKDPSRYISELWIARIYIEQNKYSEAKLLLDELQETALNQKKKTLKGVFEVFKKKNPEENQEPKMTKSLQFEIYKTQADLAIKRKQFDEAAFSLSNAVKTVNNKQEKARLYFILGQIYQQNGSVESAQDNYSKALSAAALYEVSFNARLNRAMLGNNNKLSKGLDKMLRDGKNAPYKDQIYFAKATLELNRGNDDLGKAYYTSSAFYSTSNKRQKALSYEKLGDLSFNQKAYISAQKYYDSCARFMPEAYPNEEVVKSKAMKLLDLVNSLESAQFEDSVQRIAKMPEKEQTEFLKELIKDIKKEQQRLKEAQAAKLLALQQQSNTNQNTSSNKWYFNNSKLKEEGSNEFRKLWGTRENKDDWRRSDKIVFSDNKVDKDGPAIDSAKVDVAVNQSVDTLSVESLRKGLPLTDSLFEKSIIKEMEALYTSGLLYKELLSEDKLAIAQFEKIFEMNRICLTDLSAAFQLYKLNENSGLGNQYKDYIIKYYPNSDMANYFKDPDFFTKQKEGRIAAQKEYLALISRYESKEYKVVFDATEQIVNGDRTNALRAEYLLLNALAAGQLTENKTVIIPKLTNIIDEKPGSPQALRAKEMLDIITKGYSINEALPVPKQGIYTYNDTVTQFLIVLMDQEEDANDARNDITDFNTKKFKSLKLKVQSKLTLNETGFILISEFESIKLANDYIFSYKAGYEQLDQWQNNRIQIITLENLKKLIESSNFESYKEFYDLNY